MKIAPVLFTDKGMLQSYLLTFYLNSLIPPKINKMEKKE